MKNGNTRIVPLSDVIHQMDVQDTVGRAELEVVDLQSPFSNPLAAFEAESWKEYWEEEYYDS